MIHRLEIKNYALIDHLELDFHPGLTIITGETGAGKSILLGALGLIMGKRADPNVLYDTSQKCIVEGTFDVGAYRLDRFWKDNDLEPDKEVIVRREIAPSGKSRAFVNDTPVTLKVLQQLSSSLVDLHQQFDTLDINEVSFQLRLIDALAGNQDYLDKYRSGYDKHQSSINRLDKLRTKQHATGQEQDFLQFQLEELQEAAFKNGEQEQLEEELNRLTHAEDIKRVLNLAFQQLSEADINLLDQLDELALSLRQIGAHHQGVKERSNRFDNLTLELRELAGELEHIAEETEFDGERAGLVQERLDLLYHLQKKHNLQTVDELLTFQKELEVRLDGIQGNEEEIQKLEKQIAKQRKSLLTQAADLRSRRQAVLSTFSEHVVEGLRSLAIPNAQMIIDLSPSDKLLPTGMDEIEYRFSANKGSTPQAIRNVASGGELSRLTLVTKSLVASSIPLPTLIFDEIDSGVSGDVALRIGSILRKLSDEHQVVVITHSPQVASKADRHYFVYKKDEKDRTITKVRALTNEERIRALATMLSQNPPSKSALANARELLSF